MSSFNFLDDEVSEAWPVVQLQSHHPTYIYSGNMQIYVRISECRI